LSDITSSITSVKFITSPSKIGKMQSQFLQTWLSD